MAISNLDRRHFLRAAGALSVLGPATPFALQLAAAGSAAGQTATDYKAMVCIFLFGGNDAHNMVLATDQDSWGRYFAARNTGDDPIALMPVGTPAVPIGQVSPVTGRTVNNLQRPEAWGGVLPIAPATANPVPAGTNASARTFALHPAMAPVKELFDARRLAVVANVGTLVRPITKDQYRARSVPFPANLFSHNDQQSTWQAGATEGARVGWGGRFADNLAAMNGSSTLFTAISTAGNAVFLSGQSVVQYQVSTGNTPAIVVNGQNGTTLFGSRAAPGLVREIIRDGSVPGYFGGDYARVVDRSVTSASTLNAAFASPTATGIPQPPTYINPTTGLAETNSLATQMRTVARMISSSAGLGLKRQVFFVSLGGWDTHDFQNRSQPNLLGKVAHAMAYLDATLANIGGLDLRNNVTTFTASDFSRTFNTNGDGTDHAWGGHQLVMGGAVRGGDMFGQYPTLGVDAGTFRNPDMTGNALVPTTSVDQYAATIGRWFGISDTSLASMFPNLQYFQNRTLGFLPTV